MQLGIQNIGRLLLSVIPNDIVADYKSERQARIFIQCRGLFVRHRAAVGLLGSPRTYRVLQYPTRVLGNYGLQKGGGIRHRISVRGQRSCSLRGGCLATFETAPASTAGICT
jgi:hypothetical protein